MNLNLGLKDLKIKMVTTIDPVRDLVETILIRDQELILKHTLCAGTTLSSALKP